MGLGSAFRSLNKPLQVYIQADAADRTSRTLVELILDSGGAVVYAPKSAHVIVIVDQEASLAKDLVKEFSTRPGQPISRGVVDHRWVLACVVQDKMIVEAEWGGFFIRPEPSSRPTTITTPAPSADTPPPHSSSASSYSSSSLLLSSSSASSATTATSLSTPARNPSNSGNSSPQYADGLLTPPPFSPSLQNLDGDPLPHSSPASEDRVTKGANGVHAAPPPPSHIEELDGDDDTPHALARNSIPVVITPRVSFEAFDGAVAAAAVDDGAVADANALNKTLAAADDDPEPTPPRERHVIAQGSVKGYHYTDEEVKFMQAYRAWGRRQSLVVTSVQLSSEIPWHSSQSIARWILRHPKEMSTKVLAFGGPNAHGQRLSDDAEMPATQGQLLERNEGDQDDATASIHPPATCFQNSLRTREVYDRSDRSTAICVEGETAARTAPTSDVDIHNTVAADDDPEPVPPREGWAIAQEPLNGFYYTNEEVTFLETYTAWGERQNLPITSRMLSSKMPWHSSDGIRKFLLRRRNTMTTTVSAGDTLLTEARDDDDEEPVPPVAGTSLPGQQSHRFEYTAEEMDFIKAYLGWAQRQGVSGGSKAISAKMPWHTRKSVMYILRKLRKQGETRRLPREHRTRASNSNGGASAEYGAGHVENTQEDNDDDDSAASSSEPDMHMNVLPNEVSRQPASTKRLTRSNLTPSSSSMMSSLVSGERRPTRSYTALEVDMAVRFLADNPQAYNTPRVPDGVEAPSRPANWERFRQWLEEKRETLSEADKKQLPERSVKAWIEYHRSHHKALERAADGLVRQRVSEGSQEGTTGVASTAASQDTDMAGENGREDVRRGATIPYADAIGTNGINTRVEPVQPAQTSSSSSAVQYLPVTTFTARAFETLSRIRPSALASVTPLSPQLSDPVRIKPEIPEPRLGSSTLGHMVTRGIEDSADTIPPVTPPTGILDPSNHPRVEAEEMLEPSSPSPMIESGSNPRKRPAAPETPAAVESPIVHAALTSQDAGSSPIGGSTSGETGEGSYSVKRIRLRPE